MARMMSETAVPTLPDNTSNKPAAYRWVVFLLLIVISAGISGTGILTNTPHLSANDRSRWSTVWSLVERGTYQIDEIDANPQWQTIDKVRHEGHFYSTKPALLPTMVAGVYWGVKKTTGLNLLDNTTAVVRIILLIINWVPMIIALILLAKILDRHAKKISTQVFILAAAGSATFLTTFLVTLNNHTVAATSLILTLYPAIKIVAEGKRSAWYFICAGFFAMLTCTSELPAALFGLAIFIVLFLQDRKRTLCYFAPAAIIPLVGFFITTYLSTGGWKPFYMYYGTEKYRYIYQGVPSYWMNPSGIDANLESPPVYAMHCLIGHHGIFSLSPIFLLTIAAWVGGMLKQWKNNKLRPFYWMGLGLTIAVFTFYMTRTGNYNYGGNTCGLRWMFWLIPFWLLTMIPLLDKWENKRWLQIFVAVALLVSMFSALSPLKNPWRPPWLYNLMTDWKWINYRKPHPPLIPKLTTWFRSLPNLSDENSYRWIELRSITPEGNTQRIRITDRGQTTENKRTLRKIEIKQTSFRLQGKKEILVATLTREFIIDEKLFNEGKFPNEFLIAPAISKTEKEAALAALRGLPFRKAYNAGPIRYIKTNLQENSFRCQQASVGNLFHSNPKVWEERSRLRRDVWLCDDVPFGVLKTRLTVYHHKTGNVISVQEFVADKWGK